MPRLSLFLSQCLCPVTREIRPFIPARYAWKQQGWKLHWQALLSFVVQYCGSGRVGKFCSTPTVGINEGCCDATPGFNAGFVHGPAVAEHYGDRPLRVDRVNSVFR